MILLNCGGQRLSLTSLYLLVWEDNCLPLVKWNAKKEKNEFKKSYEFTNRWSTDDWYRDIYIL